MKTLKCRLSKICALLILTFFFHSIASAETVGIFCDTTVSQIKFAASDVKKSLESKLYTVEYRPVDSLKSTYSNKKIVIAVVSDTLATKALSEQGGAIPTGLGEQAYGLRTTTSTEKTYWALGGDANGAMYGGFQIAENITFNDFTGTYNNEESPSILKRGIKLNLPFDKNSTTYFNANNSTGSKFAITNVWDITFWKTWFDEMARNRYNVLSIWNNHPFTSMIKMAECPDAAIQNVTGYPDYYNDNDKTGAVIKTMSIDQKIVFWKEVMAYAKSRGFSFYLFNWNLFLYGAEGKSFQGGTIVNDIKNTTTIAYMRKCMYELFKTYPDLDGFGITQGEAMGDYDDADKSIFLGATYGMGMADFAKDNPTRKLNFIHRWWFADFTAIKTNFAELIKQPNVTFDMSYKYSMAHMYSSTKPNFFTSSDMQSLIDNNMKSWLTVRNDDFFYHNWGDPNYAREYINNIPGKNTWFKGFYMGSDGNNPTRTYFSKYSVTQGGLEVQRQWYMYMIWGRLSYNPNTSDDVFKNYIKLKYPSVSSADLYTAWSKVSNSLTKVGEMFFSNFRIDQNWYPENCQSENGFLTIGQIAAANPLSSSNLCGISASASNNCGDKLSSFTNADQIETNANAALSLVNNMSSTTNTDLDITIKTVKAMAYLNIYYAYKLRGATYSKMTGKKTETINALSTAYCWWIKYTTLMDEMYKGMSMQRNADFASWHQHDAAVRKEYSDAGGTGAPICGDKSFNMDLTSNNDTKGSVLGGGLYNPNDLVIVTAVPKTGYRFLYWKENDSIVSSNVNYSFTIVEDKKLVGYFVESANCAFPWNDAGFTNNNAIVDKTYGPVNISCATNGVKIAVTLQGVGTDGSDFCRVYYTVDGGTQQILKVLTGTLNSQTFTSGIIKGSKVEIIVNSKTSSSDEFYYISNIIVFTETPTCFVSAVANGCTGSTVKITGNNHCDGNVTLSATVASACVFNNWTENGTLVSDQNPYTFKVNKDLQLVANFSAIPKYTITTSAYPSIGGTATGGGTLQSGLSVTVNAKASSGYTFVNWTENGTMVSDTSSYTFTVSSTRVLKANFLAIPTFTITSSSLPTEGGTTSGGGSFQSGKSVTLSALPSSGYTFVNWTENNTEVSKNSSLIFTASANRSLIANFNAIDDSSQNTSLNSDNLRDIRIYPNPTTGLLNIDFKTKSTEREINIYNTSNQLVYQSNVKNEKFVIDLKQQNLKGLAIIEIIEGDRTYIHKIFVE